MKISISIGLMLLTMSFAKAEVIPPLPVETLSGRSLMVPAQVAAAPSLFIIGFSKKSRAETSEWSRRLEKDGHDGEPPYEVAVLDDVPRLLRGLVVRAIRNGVPERLRDRFLIVSEQGDFWRRLVRFQKPDDAYLVVTGAGGKLVWRTEGKLTEERLRELLQALRSARSQ